MYHIILIVGEVESEPVTQYTSQGRPVTSFVVSARFTRQDVVGRRYHKAMFQVQSFNNEAEFMHKFLRRGMVVSVEGRLKFNDAGCLCMSSANNHDKMMPVVLARQVIIVKQKPSSNAHGNFVVHAQPTSSPPQYNEDEEQT